MHSHFVFVVSRFASVLFALVAVATCAVSRAAPPKVNYLFPAGAARGESVTVTASGSFSHWPASVWVDRPGLTVEATSQKGQVKINVKSEARLGVYWLRFYDREGAASLRPFVVGGLKEVREQEPNDTPGKPQPLEGSRLVNGVLSRSGDVDGFRISLKKGQTLVASVQAHNLLGSPMDAVLQIADPRGFVLAQNDDEVGLDPLVVFPSPADGDYLVRIFAFPETPNSTIGFAGSRNFVYRLALTTEGFLDHAFPMAALNKGPQQFSVFGWNIDSDAAGDVYSPGDEAEFVTVTHPSAANSLILPKISGAQVQDDEDASPVSFRSPAVISGRIDSSIDEDSYRFRAKKGEKIGFTLQSRSWGYPLDGVIRIKDHNGKILQEVDDAGKNRDPALQFTAPADGDYVATIGDMHRQGGFRYVYRLIVKPATGDYSVDVQVDSFVLQSEKTLDIPVRVNRENGFDQPIQIAIEGLPGQARCKPVISPGKGSQAKSVKLQVTGQAEWSGPIRIVAKVGGEKGARRVARFSLGPGPLMHTAVWLTVKK